MTMHLGRACALAASFVTLSCSSPTAPLHPQPTTHASFSLSFDSDPGDFIGQGRRFTLTQADGTLEVAYPTKGGRPTNSLTISFHGRSTGNFWNFSFVGPDSTRIQRGTYDHVLREPFQGVNPGLDVSGDSRGCNVLTGRFVVHEAVYDSEGLVRRLLVDYEQHCEGAVAALRGTVRIG